MDTNVLPMEVLFDKDGIAFSLRLPANWMYKKNISDKPITERTILFSANSQSYTSELTPTNGADGLYPPVQLLVRYFDDAGLDLSEWFAQHKPELVIGYVAGQYEISENDMIIHTVPSKSFQIHTTTDGVEHIDNSFYDRYIFLKNDGKVFELHIYGKPIVIDKLASLLDQIVLSFKLGK
jgi:hypothetical protein